MSANSAEGAAMKYSIVDGKVVATGKWPTSKLGALKESIKKWEWIAKLPIEDGSGPRADGWSCALCRLHANSAGFVDCKGCPVEVRTRISGCRGTPYVDYYFLRNKAAASAEVKFLKALLPKGRR